MAISTQSEMNLSTTIRAARGCARPHVLHLAQAIVVGQDRLDRAELNSARCGRAWTLAQIRKAERDILSAIRANRVGGGA
jgi:hypothetical protein